MTLRRLVAVVDGNAPGRRGIEALLDAMPAFCLCASVDSPAAFWQLPDTLLWRLDELLVHPTSLSGNPLAARLFLRQVRMMLPGLRVRVMVSGPLTGVADAADAPLDYRAPLPALRRALCRGAGDGASSSLPGTLLTVGEWRALVGAIKGLSAPVQARLTGRSAKTLYALRYTGMHKLGLSLTEFLTEGNKHPGRPFTTPPPSDNALGEGKRYP